MSAESSRVASVPSAATDSAELSSIISLLHHYVSCKDDGCTICTAVWATDTETVATSTTSSSSPPPSSRGVTPRAPLRPHHSEQQLLDETYLASQMLHFLLYCLLARGSGRHYWQASCAVQRGKAIWEGVLRPVAAEGFSVACRNGKRLMYHRVTCQHGRSCPVCGYALCYLERRQPQQPQQQATSRGSSSRAAAAQAAPDEEAATLAMELELETALQHMTTEFAHLQL